jgi:hypothetical protein
VDLRIGVIQTPRELNLELADDADREALKAQIDEAMTNDKGVLWLTDRRGRQVGVPVKQVGYIELGPVDGDRRIGFGS